MVVVLCVAGVLALLRVGPATHLLQAAGGVPTLNQAQGLRAGEYQQQSGGSEPPDAVSTRHSPPLAEGNPEAHGTAVPVPRSLAAPRSLTLAAAGIPSYFRECACTKPCTGTPVC